MRGAVRPRVLAVAAAAAVCLVALGGLASLAVWGFRHGDTNSSTTVGGWLALVWVGVAVGVVLVVVVALAGARALRRPLIDLSRQANQLQVERIPAALREIEAGGEPAPRPGFTAPPELEGVAGALENLERFVHYHAKRAQHADRDLGRLLTGAADRVGARARLAEGIDFDAPDDFAAGLHRDEEALRALVPDTVATDPHDDDTATAGPGPSIADALTAASRTTLRPAGITVGEVEPALLDAAAADAVGVVLGEVLDAALAVDGDLVISGSAQPEGYHCVIDASVGERADELASIAEGLRERDPANLPFGLRAAVQAGRRARLLLWLTVAGQEAQWHVLVPPDSFFAVPVPVSSAGQPLVKPVDESAPEPVVDLVAAEAEEAEEAAAATEAESEAEPAPVVAPKPFPAPTAARKVVVPQPVVENGARVASDRRLGDALTNLFERLETALAARAPGGRGLDEDERVALLVDGTRLVGNLQQAGLCSSRDLRSLLRAIDVAVGADRIMPLTGSARDAATLPYEVLQEIRLRIDANGK